MNETLKVLDQKGVEYLWSKISMQDYPNNETLISVIAAIDETKADKAEIPFIDDTLVLKGAAADAKATGEAIAAPKYVAQDTAPEDTNLLWIDTSDEVGACIKYYNTTTQTWENTSASTSPSINMDEILDKMYPVGAIYLSVNDTSPASIYGGTWEQIEDVFLLGAGSAYAAGTTGGEATHTLTIPEMPMHDHIVNAHSHAIGLDNDTTRGTYGWSLHMSANGSTVNGAQLTVVSGTASPGTNARGGGLAHNNMPPYLTVYMWKRIE